jgi:hypothetical protein
MKKIQKFVALFLLISTIAVSFTAPFAKQAQAVAVSVDTDYWNPNNYVYAIHPTADKVYLGGTFDYVGPNTGSAMAFDATTGDGWDTFPKINGQVNAIVSDGSGGWYVGGAFTTVNGVTKNNLVHVNADGSVDSGFVTELTSSGGVYSMVKDGNYLFIGGSFNYTSTVDSLTRVSLAKINATTGATETWRANVNSFVRSVVVIGTQLYAAGDFSQVTIGVTTSTRGRVLAINKDDMTLSSFNPAPNSTVYSLWYDGTTYLYIGGSYTSISSGAGRNALRRYTASTNTFDSTWTPSIVHAPVAEVFSVVTIGTNVYFTGNFTTVKSTARSGMAAVSNVGAGTLQTFNSSGLLPGSYLHASVNGNIIYLVGTFRSVDVGGVTPRDGFAAVDVTGNAGVGSLTSLVYHGSNEGYAVANDGTSVAIGGNHVGTGGEPARGLAVLDKATGHAVTQSFDLGLGAFVYDFEAVSSTLYFGGRFTGASRDDMAGMNMTTGSLTSFSHTFNNDIKDINYESGVLYVNGWFETIDGSTTRNYLVAFDEATGAITSWNPNSDDGIDDAVLDGHGNMYVTGFFSTIGANALTRHFVAKLELATGNTVAGWDLSPGFTCQCSADTLEYVEGPLGNYLYIGGIMTRLTPGYGNGSIQNMFEVSATDGAINQSFEPDPDDEIFDFLYDDNVLYVGGNGSFNQLWDGTQTTDPNGDTFIGLVAFDIWDTEGNGRNIVGWSPRVQNLNGVRKLAIDDDGLYVGGQFTRLNGGATEAYNFAVLAPTSVTSSTPTIEFSSASSSGLESVTSASVQVELSAISGSDATVNYTVTGGTATGGGVDYTLASGTATITAGNTTTTIPITVVNDVIDESNETIQITLSSPSGATLGTETVSTYTILDDDGAGVTVDPTTISATEGGATGSYTVVLDTEPTDTVTIAVSPDSQVTVDQATLTFTTGNWDEPQTVVVTAVNDAVVEGSHTGVITHTATSATDAVYDGISVASVTVNITDYVSPPGGGGGGGDLPDALGPVSISVTDEPTSTDSSIVTLTFSVDPEYTEMAISNLPDLSDAPQQPYQPVVQWDVCSINTDCPDGDYIVYAQFYTEDDEASPIVAGVFTIGEGSATSTSQNSDTPGRLPRTGAPFSVYGLLALVPFYMLVPARKPYKTKKVYIRLHN